MLTTHLRRNTCLDGGCVGGDVTSQDGFCACQRHGPTCEGLPGKGWDGRREAAVTGV